MNYKSNKNKKIQNQNQIFNKLLYKLINVYWVHNNYKVYYSSNYKITSNKLKYKNKHMLEI